ncbi:hydantoin racemase family protein [Schizosaccharomyces cryophilus OY26]|uniref:Hydantoin racemase family protein n=1 Tax=Schizosaccharomyces cryophilus (strain OY26 / ATCC MYA-4695 / CBS 11777 / NBRC 106824 / NRRL Y48691) TaxID=653667 RepID=S9VYV3_SCHCR|nr:hydantoin racemase family protein [Schizosaccharomyces cryophilus OY26]EPY51389.1 hydantoin racemase family protein [Schizosaccharomyces cryophilus OY26]
MVRILIINPNSTGEMTNNVKKVLASCTPPNVELHFLTCPPEGPAAIESMYDGIISTSVVMKYLKCHPPQCDAFLIACYSDHPLVSALREAYRKPCLGIMQASIFMALSVGRKVAIVTTTNRYGPLLTAGVRAMGISDSVFGGVVSTGLTPLELESKPHTEVDALVQQSSRKATQEMGADVICLGCAGMAHMLDVVQQAVGPDIPVVEGAKAGVGMLTCLVQMNLFTSKAGAYQAIQF